MNDKFYELPQDKQQKIINAGFKSFGTNEYKKASTEYIASDAGISKGLLFYYFHNKKEYYQFLYDYAFKTVTAQVVDDGYKKITDFFELLKYCAEKKYAMLSLNPHLMDFIMKYYLAQDKEVSDNNNMVISDFTENMYEVYLKNIDFTKFREDVDPKEIINMIYYTSDGYMQDIQRQNKPFDLDEIMAVFDRYCILYKRIAYKEEYI